MRQLVELQLEHNADIKSSIDLAWGVQHNKHRKKELQDPPPPDSSDPMSKENLQLIPIGQDAQRKRYWVVDGPCIISTFRCSNFRICTYLGAIDVPQPYFNSPLFSRRFTRLISLHMALCSRFAADIYLNQPLEDGCYLSDDIFHKGGVHWHR